MEATQQLHCQIVCERYDQKTPLFVSVDLDPRVAFDRAKRWLNVHNRRTKTKTAVIRKGDANVSWQMY